MRVKEPIIPGTLCAFDSGLVFIVISSTPTTAFQVYASSPFHGHGASFCQPMEDDYGDIAMKHENI